MNNIKTFYKNLFLTVLITLLHPAYAVQQNGYSDVTIPIVGNAPYIGSLGVLAEYRKDIFDENFEPAYVEGTYIYIPITECHSHETGDSFFQQKDSDDDACLIDPNELTWYIVEPKNTSWNEVNRWDELIHTVIDNERFNNTILPPNEKSLFPSLKIPKEAVGKRIGLSYKPKTLEGNPIEGPMIYLWDLNHFFAQTPITTPENNQKINEGSKIGLNPSFIGEEVIPLIEVPKIENLFLSGRFGIDEQIEAKYDFIANTSEEYTEISRFWWGELGSTHAQATIDNDKWMNSALSPKLTESNIGNIYEVSILPIKKEKGLIAIGSPVTVDTTHSANTLILAPNIENAKIFYASTQSTVPPIYTAKIGDKIIIKYDFISKSENLNDSSTYSWINKTSGTELSKGKVSEEQPDVEYVISENDIGQVLQAIIQPTDSSDLKGISTKIDIPASLNYPSVSDLRFVNTPSFTQNVNAVYTFNNYGVEEIKDNSSFNWYYIDENGDKKELSSGNIIESGIVPALSTPSMELIGKTLGLEIVPNDQFERRNKGFSVQNRLPSIDKITIFDGETINLSDLVPIKLESFAHFSNDEVIQVTQYGTWKIDNPRIEIVDGNTMRAQEDSIGEEAQLTFKYNGIETTSRVVVVKSKLSDITGTESEFKTIISAETYPIIKIYGSAIWDGIRDPDNNQVIAGGPGGKLGGDVTLNNSNTFNFDDNITSISGLSIKGTPYFKEGFLIKDLVWNVVENGQTKQKYFKGNQIVSNLETRLKSIEIESKVFGWIVYSSGTVGKDGTYIQGLRIVYY
ncbi:hypothetical protein [Thorsellia kenyensis]|uniref:Uncharacterized protein n=1 Tax=Thorsellia kenyensis TaxID=1549888 RepID=A0ABV6C7F8_9GAMM